MSVRELDAVEHRVVGRSVPRVDGHEKVTGAARFAIDLSVPGMAHAAVVRSEVAHGRLLGIDTEAARAVDGVLAVLTAADFPQYDLRFGHIVRDHPVLASDRVRYHGEPIALVVARTRRAALAAARLVEAEYEELDAVIDVHDALAPDAIELHPPAGRDADPAFLEFQGDTDVRDRNVCAEMEVGWGDVDAAFAEADVVVEGVYRFPMLYAYAMEPYNALATYEGGRLTVHTTQQHPYSVREELARIFELPMGRVRVVAGNVGGGYGSKAHMKVEALAALGAIATGRPVKLVLSVEESILTTRADSAEIRARSGFRADGRLCAREFDILLNTGAYTDASPLVTNKAAHRCFGPYAIPALRVRARAIFTNTVAASSFRGFGAPQGSLAGEAQMDEAAARLGIDAHELRRRNLVAPGGEILPDRRPIETDLADDLRQLTDALAWDAGRPPAGRDGRLRGTGFAVTASDAGSYPTSVAMVRIHADGSASVSIGSTELGQGRSTVMSQIVAEELELPFERVSIFDADTAVVPYERATGASRSTTLAGRALQAACRDARATVRRFAAEAYGVAPEEVHDAPGGVEVAGKPRSYRDVIRAWFGSGGEVVGIGSIRRDGDLAQLPAFWEVGCCGVAIAVDRETGAIEVERLATVGDVGFAVNPALVEGQDAGAAMMGLGLALSEQLVYDGETLVNPNVVEYKVPRISDLPRETVQRVVQRRDGVGPYGAKGAGEGSLNPMGAAMAAAVTRAVGAPARELPLTPERVWRLLRAAEHDDATTRSQDR